MDLLGFQPNKSACVGMKTDLSLAKAVWIFFQTAYSINSIHAHRQNRSACRSDSRIRHLFAEQGTHIALADGQMSDSRIRPTRMMLPNCFYFVRLFFRIGIKRLLRVWIATYSLYPFFIHPPYQEIKAVKNTRQPLQTTQAKPAHLSPRSKI